jgi:hypothetical protein
VETSSEVVPSERLELTGDANEIRSIGDAEEEDGLVSEVVLSEELELLVDKEEGLIFKLMLSNELELLDE